MKATTKTHNNPPHDFDLKTQHCKHCEIPAWAVVAFPNFEVCSIERGTTDPKGNVDSQK